MSTSRLAGRIALGLMTIVGTLVVSWGAAGATTHQAPPKQHIKIGEHFTVELSTQGEPPYCFREVIVSTTQFTTDSTTFTPDGLGYGFLTDGTPWISETVNVPAFATTFGVYGEWDHSTRSFQGFYSNGGPESPATIKPGRIEGITC